MSNYVSELLKNLWPTLEIYCKPKGGVSVSYIIYSAYIYTHI